MVPDVSVTWGITILMCCLILHVSCKVRRECLTLSLGKRKIWFIAIYFVVLIYLPFVMFIGLADSRTRFAFPKSESKKPIQAYKWREACDWISNEKNIPKSAKFFIPHDSVTFKWYANRSNVTVWKEVPQDAKSIVQWAESIEELFGNSNGRKDDKKDNSSSSSKNNKTNDRGMRSELLINRMSKKPFSQMLSQTTPDNIRRLRKKYGFDYILAPANPDLSKRFGFRVVYKNSEYCVYKIEH
jgi:hypothetical protein